MPFIMLKQHEWNETLGEIYINVQIPGVSLKNSDIFITDKYVKISCSPYMWEIFLKHSVNRSKSVANIECGIVRLRLLKEEQMLWKELCEPLMGDRASLIQKRQQEIEKMHKFQEDEKKSLELKRQHWNSSVIEEQMRLEEKDKQRIKEIKDKDKLETLKIMFGTPPDCTQALSKDVPAEDARPTPPPRNSGNMIVLQFTEGRKGVPTRECRK